MRLTIFAAAATFAISAAYAATTYDGNGQVPQQFVLSGKAADRLHDHVSINLETAEKLVAACQAIARKSNSSAAIVVLDAQGLPVLESRMDGAGMLQMNATVQKTLTALRTRAPSHALTNRNVQDPFTSQNMAGYGLTVNKGGLPIVVNGQIIGAMGAGGMGTANAEESCVHDALEEVIGPQPALLPDVTAQPNNTPGAGRGGRGNGAPNQ
jgi:glc operon protein GlcG